MGSEHNVGITAKVLHDYIHRPDENTHQGIMSMTAEELATALNSMTEEQIQAIKDDSELLLRLEDKYTMHHVNYDYNGTSKTILEHGREAMKRVSHTHNMEDLHHEDDFLATASDEATVEKRKAHLRVLKEKFLDKAEEKEVFTPEIFAIFCDRYKSIFIKDKQVNVPKSADFSKLGQELFLKFLTELVEKGIIRDIVDPSDTETHLLKKFTFAVNFDSEEVKNLLNSSKNSNDMTTMIPYVSGPENHSELTEELKTQLDNIFDACRAETTASGEYELLSTDNRISNLISQGVSIDQISVYFLTKEGYSLTYETDDITTFVITCNKNSVAVNGPEKLNLTPDQERLTALRPKCGIMNDGEQDLFLSYGILCYVSKNNSGEKSGLEMVEGIKQYFIGLGIPITQILEGIIISLLRNIFGIKLIIKGSINISKHQEVITNFDNMYVRLSSEEPKIIIPDSDTVIDTATEKINISSNQDFVTYACPIIQKFDRFSALGDGQHSCTPEEIHLLFQGINIVRGSEFSDTLNEHLVLGSPLYTSLERIDFVKQGDRIDRLIITPFHEEEYEEVEAVDEIEETEDGREIIALSDASYEKIISTLDSKYQAIAKQLLGGLQGDSGFQAILVKAFASAKKQADTINSTNKGKKNATDIVLFEDPDPDLGVFLSHTTLKENFRSLQQVIIRQAKEFYDANESVGQKKNSLSIPYDPRTQTERLVITNFDAYLDAHEVEDISFTAKLAARNISEIKIDPSGIVTIQSLEPFIYIVDKDKLGALTGPVKMSFPLTRILKKGDQTIEVGGYTGELEITLGGLEGDLLDTVFDEAMDEIDFPNLPYYDFAKILLEKAQTFSQINAGQVKTLRSKLSMLLSGGYMEYDAYYPYFLGQLVSAEKNIRSVAEMKDFLEGFLTPDKLKAQTLSRNRKLLQELINTLINIPDDAEQRSLLSFRPLGRSVLPVFDSSSDIPIKSGGGLKAIWDSLDNDDLSFGGLFGGNSSSNFPPDQWHADGILRGMNKKVTVPVLSEDVDTSYSVNTTIDDKNGQLSCTFRDTNAKNNGKPIIIYGNLGDMETVRHQIQHISGLSETVSQQLALGFEGSLVAHLQEKYGSLVYQTNGNEIHEIAFDEKLGAVLVITDRDTGQNISSVSLAQSGNIASLGEFLLHVQGCIDEILVQKKNNLVGRGSSSMKDYKKGHGATMDRNFLDLRKSSPITTTGFQGWFERAIGYEGTGNNTSINPIDQMESQRQYEYTIGSTRLRFKINATGQLETNIIIAGNNKPIKKTYNSFLDMYMDENKQIRIAAMHVFPQFMKEFLSEVLESNIITGSQYIVTDSMGQSYAMKKIGPKNLVWSRVVRGSGGSFLEDEEGGQNDKIQKTICSDLKLSYDLLGQIYPTLRDDGYVTAQETAEQEKVIANKAANDAARKARIDELKKKGNQLKTRGIGKLQNERKDLKNMKF